MQGALEGFTPQFLVSARDFNPVVVRQLTVIRATGENTESKPPALCLDWFHWFDEIIHLLDDSTEEKDEDDEDEDEDEEDDDDDDEEK